VRHAEHGVIQQTALGKVGVEVVGVGVEGETSGFEQVYGAQTHRPGDLGDIGRGGCGGGDEAGLRVVVGDDVDTVEGEGVEVQVEFAG
jgi:hypothetical protein